MGKELEALKRLRQETCPATYMDDFDKNECCDVIEQALNRLESIDNAEPSEALEMLEGIGTINLGSNPYTTFESDMLKNVYKPEFNIIKQALLKAQQPKHYLKWDDLEFKEMYKIISVRMGDNVYQMAYCLYENEGYIRLEDCQRIYLELFANEKKFFNDLHLEVVE